MCRTAPPECRCASKCTSQMVVLLSLSRTVYHRQVRSWTSHEWAFVSSVGQRISFWGAARSPSRLLWPRPGMPETQSRTGQLSPKGNHFGKARGILKALEQEGRSDAGGAISRRRVNHPTFRGRLCWGPSAPLSANRIVSIAEQQGPA
jgi:hypothetical protein